MKSMKTVEMLQSTSVHGELRPLRFRLSDDRIITVKCIIKTVNENLAGNPMIVYEIEGAIDELVIRACVKFESSTCKWYLLRLTRIGGAL